MSECAARKTPLQQEDRSVGGAFCVSNQSEARYRTNAAFNHGHVGPGMAVLTKPFAISELARRVERMLGRN